MDGELHIDRLFAYIVMDDDNTEGIPAFLNSTGMWYPMVGADPEMANKLWDQAQSIATELGKKVTLVEFTTRHEMHVFEPGGSRG